MALTTSTRSRQLKRYSTCVHSAVHGSRPWGSVAVGVRGLAGIGSRHADRSLSLQSLNATRAVQARGAYQCRVQRDAASPLQPGGRHGGIEAVRSLPRKIEVNACARNSRVLIVSSKVHRVMCRIFWDT
jgi:hypothetical protein